MWYKTENQVHFGDRVKIVQSEYPGVIRGGGDYGYTREETRGFFWGGLEAGKVGLSKTGAECDRVFVDPQGNCRILLAGSLALIPRASSLFSLSAMFGVTFTWGE